MIRHKAAIKEMYRNLSENWFLVTCINNKDNKADAKYHLLPTLNMWKGVSISAFDLAFVQVTHVKLVSHNALCQKM